MTFRGIAVVVAALSVGMAASGAGAVTFDLLGSSTNSGGNQADVFAGSFGGYTPTGASWSVDPLVTPPPGSVSGSNLSPFANTGIAETQSYFSSGAVAANGGAPSPVTLSFATPVFGSIDLLWGSIDSYNELTLTFGDPLSTQFSIDGAQLVNDLFLSGTGPNFNEVALLRISDFGDFGLTDMTFTSTSAAFEFAFAPVPLPASLLLLLGGLGGLSSLAFLSRRSDGATA